MCNSSEDSESQPSVACPQQSTSSCVAAIELLLNQIPSRHTKANAEIIAKIRIQTGILINIDHEKDLQNREDELRHQSEKLKMQQQILEMDREKLEVDREKLEVKRLKQELETRLTHAELNDCRPTTSQQNLPLSYARAVAKPAADTRQIVRILPKEGKDLTSDSTKSLLLATVKSTNIGVKKIKSYKKGVSVICRNAEDAKTLSDKLKDHDQLDSTVPEKTDPVFTFFWPGLDVPEGKVDVLEGNKEKNELHEHIVGKNPDLLKYLEQGEEFKYIYKKRTDNDNLIVTASVPPSAYRAIINSPSLAISWTFSKFTEQIPAKPCFNCGVHNSHQAKNCRFQIDGTKARKCFRCGKNHSRQGDKPGAYCRAEVNCGNCEAHNKLGEGKKGWEVYDTKHQMDDKNCRVFLAALDSARLLVNYGQN